MRNETLRLRRALMVSTLLAVPTAALASNYDSGWDQFLPERSVRESRAGTPNMGVDSFGFAPTSVSSKAFGAESSSTWVNPSGIISGSFIVFNVPPPVVPAPPPADPTGWSVASSWGNGVPAAGGTAQFGRPGVAGALERSAGISLQLDVNSSVSQIDVSNPRGLTIFRRISAGQPTGGTAFTAGVGGLTINNNNFFPEPLLETFLYFGNDLQPAITGPGSVTVTGDSAIRFGTVAKDFSGGLFVQNGIITLTELAATATNFGGSPFVGDAALGAAGTTLTLDGGEVRIFSNLQTPTPVVLDRPIHIGPGGGRFVAGGTQPLTVNSVISGTGKLTLGWGTSFPITSQNTHTGILEIDSFAASPIRVTGGGSLQSSSIIVKTPFALEGGSSSRLAQTSTVRLEGAQLSVEGFAGSIDQQIGRLEVSGLSTLTLAGDFLTTVLRTGEIARQNGGVLFVRGNLLGAAEPGDSATNLFIGNAAALLVGGGGAADTTNQSILPFVFGHSVPEALEAISAQTAGAGAGSLVTYDAARGVRPLNLTTEYRQGLASAVAGDNVRITAAETVTGTKTVNALLHGSAANSPTAGASTVSGGTINVTSGVIMNTTAGNTIASNINFGSAEGIVIASSLNNSPDDTPLDGHNGFLITGSIAGTGGLTKVGQGHLYLTGANTYTGRTTILGGRLILAQAGTIPADGVTPNPFGLDTSAIRLVAGGANVQGGGANFTRFLNESGGTITINRDLEIIGDGTNVVQIGGFRNATTTALTVINGDVSIQSKAELSILVSPVVINGDVSGPGPIGFAGGSTLTLTGDNAAWSGGLQFGGTAGQRLFVGSDTALGTGEVYLSGIHRISAIGGAREISNRVVLDEGPSILDGGAGGLTFSGEVDLAGAIHIMLVTDVVSMENVRNGGLRLQNRSGTAAGSVVVTPGTLVLSGASGLDDRIFIGDAGAPSATTPILPAPGGTLRVTHSQGLGEAQVQIESNGSALEIGNSINDLTERTYFVRPGTGGIANAGAIRATDGNNVISGLVAYRGALGDGTLLSGALGSVIGVDTGASLKIDGTILDITGATTVGTGGAPDTRAAGNLVLSKVGDGLLEVGAVRADQLIVDPNNSSQNVSVERAFTRIDVQAGTLKLALSPAATPNDNHLWIKELNLAGGASPSATLDITDNTVVMGSQTDPNTVLAQLQSGFNGGNWNGPGIITSAVVTGSKGIAIADAGEFILAANTPDDFPAAAVALGLRDEVTLDFGSLILSFTLRGDVNIDGAVGFSDLLTIAQNYGTASGANWLLGDSDYNGSVEFDDLLALAQNYGSSLMVGAIDHGEFGHLFTGDLANDWATARALVPEPATLGLIAGAGLLAMRRRRA